MSDTIEQRAEDFVDSHKTLSIAALLVKFRQDEIATLEAQLESYRNGTLEARVKELESRGIHKIEMSLKRKQKELEAKNEQLAKQFVDMKSYADCLDMKFAEAIDIINMTGVAPKFVEKHK